MRHGKRNILARIEDEQWLRRFPGKQVDVRPGDALRCTVQIENNYGYDNELVSERFTVSEVLEVLVNRVELLELPLEDDPDDNPS